MTRFKNSEEWLNLAKGMESYLLSTSDEDILKEEADGSLSAEALQDSMLKSTNKFRRQRLESARQFLAGVPKENSRLPASVYSSTPQQRLALLRSALQQQPGMTAQFRQLERMTDEDVLSALEDLAALQELTKIPGRRDT